MAFNLSFLNKKPFDVVGMGLNSIDFLSLVPRFPESNSKVKILRFARSGGGQATPHGYAALNREPAIRSLMGWPNLPASSIVRLRAILGPLEIWQRKRGLRPR